jgi:phenylacetate-coenzyme A ligase PaaK-like adenylate-forming protein
VSPAISEKITKAWGCKVYEHYGMTEMGLGGGVFCEALNGYHLREADMIFEIVDPLTGKRIPDGNYGEIVFTTLTRKGMPLIRYRTGDISRFLIEPCPCGTVLKTMDRVQHRIASEVKLSNGQTVTMPMLEDIIFAIEGILDFDAEIYIESGIEILKVSISSLEEFEIIKQILLIAIEKSIIGSSIKSGTIKININMQGKMELDIKAIRKRNLIDRR